MSRKLIKEYQASLYYYGELIEEAEKLNTLSEAEIGALRGSVGALKSALSFERIALVEKEKEVVAYQKELKEVTKKKNFYKSLAKITGSAAVVLGIVLLTTK